MSLAASAGGGVTGPAFCAQQSDPAGGTIAVTIEVGEQHIRWRVRDEGIGIPLAARQRLFERFYRAENARQLPIGGMGIGLFVVQQLVSLHGGTVEVTSKEGQGTTLIVQLPRARTTAGEQTQP
jgi:signal transduction histidine kinase